jgi:beta-phosphoglucomutase
MIAAIIYDLDGTLVNSLPIHYEAYRRAFIKHNLILTKEHYYSNIGGSAKECMPKLVRNQICSISLEELHKVKKDIFLNLLTEIKIETLETAKLLPLFYGKYKLAIASAGAKSQVFAILEQTKLIHYFDVILTGDDVQNGKPSPEVFLLAAKKMNVPPESCYVFEDSIDGINAAIASGMPWFDVKRTVCK